MPKLAEGRIFWETPWAQLALLISYWLVKYSVRLIVPLVRRRPPTFLRLLIVDSTWYGLDLILTALAVVVPFLSVQASGVDLIMLVVLACVGAGGSLTAASAESSMLRSDGKRRMRVIYSASVAASTTAGSGFVLKMIALVASAH